MHYFSRRGHLLSVLSFLVLLDITGATFAQTQPAKAPLVKVEYDATKDITQISLNPFVLASRKFEELRLGAVTGYQGKTKVRPKEVVLIFLSLSSSDNNKYETARKLTIVADDQRLALGETSRAKQSQNGLFVETMMISIPFEDFLKISNAKQVSIKLGLTETQLDSAQIGMLRIAASYMTE